MQGEGGSPSQHDQISLHMYAQAEQSPPPEMIMQCSANTIPQHMIEPNSAPAREPTDSWGLPARPQKFRPLGQLTAKHQR